VSARFVWSAKQAVRRIARLGIRLVPGRAGDDIRMNNEKDLPVAFNDVDFCLKLKEKGYRNVWTPHAELYHYESASRGVDTTPKRRARLGQPPSDAVIYRPTRKRHLPTMRIGSTESLCSAAWDDLGIYKTPVSKGELHGRLRYLCTEL
jgi:hypothetical protein